ncbi:MAG: DUF2339 domain-containing protein [Candidatus Paceibacterota bacterium]|jgi:uncharacterized membrane protein
MEFVIFIFGIVILIFVFNLRVRVKDLEELVKSGETQLIPKSSSESSLSQLKKEQPITPLTEPALELSPLEPTSFDKFSEWLKEDWLLKLGALLLLIGFGWLTTYAFLNNWIGPTGRIALGIVAGTLFLLLGWRRIEKYINQGSIFLVLGSTTILLTIFAAREIYGFFTPISALAVMFLSTAFVALISVKYNNRYLSFLSLVLAGIAPLLTNTPSPDYISLFSYLFVVILGTIWIVVLTGRRELVTAALLLVTLYSLPRLFSPISTDLETLLLFAYAFAAVFFLTNTAGILRLKNKEIIPDLVTAAGSGLFLIIWIMTAAQDEWKSLIIAAWMVVFAVGAFLIFKITQRREPFYVYAGVGVAMLAAATSAELKGATLTIAYTIECAFIVLVAYLALRDIKVVERISLLLAGPVVLSFGSITSNAWAEGFLHKDFFVLLVLGLTFLGLGSFFLRRLQGVDDKESRKLSVFILIVGSLYIYVLLWLSLQATLQNNNTAVMISLVVYTIIGLICYFYGLKNDKRAPRLYGGALIGFVVGRLLFVDVWRMELAGRIVTFFLIGALLVSTAFLGKKKRNLNLPSKT